jgi:hypothetical protein
MMPNRAGGIAVSIEVTNGGALSELPGDPIPHELIREELERILRSDEFRASKRSQEFLRYVVEQTLKGSTDILKERTIGVDVFHRSPDYDPGEDATVRVKAGEVRKRLGLYYATGGSHDTVRIELPSGSYVPGFRRIRPHNELAPGAAVRVLPELAPTESRLAMPASKRSFVSPYLWLALPLLGLLIAATVFVVVRTHPETTVLGQFWAPVFKDNAPVSLCVAFVPVYGLDREPTPAAPPRPEEFVELKDQFVGAGDLIASMRLASMLTRQKRPYLLKVGNDVSFHDLRATPAILIGYSYTRWKEISSQMRYFIDASQTPVGITDNGKPTAWVLPNLPRDRKTDRDFAIVSRVFHPDTHAMLVELAGVTSYGTDAAGDLVTNPDLVAEALRGAPAGWQQKNLQLVLSVKVIGGTPASPKVVGSHFW